VDAAETERDMPRSYDRATVELLWEAAQQHACTTYQALLQTPLTVPAVGRLKQALATLKT
jgi:hypothetical protein